MEQLGNQWSYFREIWYLSIFRKFVEKIQGSLKSAKNKFQFYGSVHHTSINENTNLMQQSLVFISPQSSTVHVSGVTSTHDQELQTCTIRYGIT